jgi:hypothetical protein
MYKGEPGVGKDRIERLCGRAELKGWRVRTKGRRKGYGGRTVGRKGERVGD